MFWNKKNRSRKQDLDKIGQILIRANSLSDPEAEATVSSPYLFGRIKAGLVRNEGQSDISGWGRIILAARFAVPAMVITTVSAVLLFWLTLSNSNVSNTTNDPLLVHPDPTIIPQKAASACYMSIKEQCSLSNDEALTMIFNQIGREGQK